MSSPFLTDFDAHLFAEGTHYRTYDKMGARPAEVDGTAGTYFAVWAPNARSVAVVGDFNSWDSDAHPMKQYASIGIWEAFIPGVH